MDRGHPLNESFNNSPEYDKFSSEHFLTMQGNIPMYLYL